MIYLFDDNEFGQMSQNYGVNLLEELSRFKGIIRHIDTPLSIKDLDIFFLHAKAIFIHASFPPNDFRDRVCYNAEEKGIPLVIFTGGEAATAWDSKKENIIRRIKKDRFYHYLIPFLKNRLTSPDEAIEIKKLVFGKNYEVEKSLIIQDRLGLFLFGSAGGFNYETDFRGGTQEYKDLLELFYFLYPEGYESEFSKFEEQCLNQGTDAKSFFIEVKKIVAQIINTYE